jgi:hypothetical protein
MIYDRIEYDVLNRIYRQYVPDDFIFLSGMAAIDPASGRTVRWPQRRGRS